MRWRRAQALCVQSICVVVRPLIIEEGHCVGPLTRVRVVGGEVFLDPATGIRQNTK